MRAGVEGFQDDDGRIAPRDEIDGRRVGLAHEVEGLGPAVAVGRHALHVGGRRDDLGAHGPVAAGRGVAVHEGGVIRRDPEGLLRPHRPLRGGPLVVAQADGRGQALGFLVDVAPAEYQSSTLGPRPRTKPGVPA